MENWDGAAAPGRIAHRRILSPAGRQAAKALVAGAASVSGPSPIPTATSTHLAAPIVLRQPARESTWCTPLHSSARVACGHHYDENEKGGDVSPADRHA